MRNSLNLVGLFLTSLLLVGCNTNNEVAKAVLPQVCDSFPDSVLYRIDPRLLWVQTQVDGISAETALVMFRTACQEAPKKIGKLTIDITTEMNFAHKRFLVMSFKKFFVVWDVRDGLDARGIPRANVSGIQQANSWFSQHLGFTPAASQIFVVNLADVLNAQGDQPIQGRPLSEIQFERKQ
jgi:hypothetical protein